jgi:hypothetical protein
MNLKLIGTALFLAAATAAINLAAGENDMQAKLRRIVIDHLEFEEVSLPVVIEHLKARAKALDPDGRGINVMLLPPKDEAEPIPTVTLAVDEMPLDDLIRYICLAIDYQYKFERHAVVIAPKSRALDTMETRSFPVAPDTVRSLTPKPD